MENKPNCPWKGLGIQSVRHLWRLGVGRAFRTGLLDICIRSNYICCFLPPLELSSEKISVFSREYRFGPILASSPGTWGHMWCVIAHITHPDGSVKYAAVFILFRQEIVSSLKKLHKNISSVVKPISWQGKLCTQDFQSAFWCLILLKYELMTQGQQTFDDIPQYKI